MHGYVYNTTLEWHTFVYFIWHSERSQLINSKGRFPFPHMWLVFEKREGEPGMQWAPITSLSGHSVNFLGPWRSVTQISAGLSVVSGSLRPHGLQPARLLCPWDSPGKNTGVGSHSLLQGIFLTQVFNLSLPHCRHILHSLSHHGIPGLKETLK